MTDALPPQATIKQLAQTADDATLQALADVYVYCNAVNCARPARDPTPQGYVWSPMLRWPPPSAQPREPEYVGWAGLVDSMEMFPVAETVDMLPGGRGPLPAPTVTVQCVNAAETTAYWGLNRVNPVTKRAGQWVGRVRPADLFQFRLGWFPRLTREALEDASTYWEDPERDVTRAPIFESAHRPGDPVYGRRFLFYAVDGGVDEAQVLSEFPNEERFMYALGPGHVDFECPRESSLDWLLGEALQALRLDSTWEQAAGDLLQLTEDTGVLSILYNRFIDAELAVPAPPNKKRRRAS